MFVLAELKSTVKVHPSLFSKGLADVAKFELNKKLANKVLHKSKHEFHISILFDSNDLNIPVGLMISFREVVSFQDSSILPVDGKNYILE